MRKYLLTTIAVAATLAVTAPTASAQLGLPLQATYNDHFVGHNGTPGCPGDAYECGSGVAAGLGSFTDTVVFDSTTSTAIRTLVFADGSTLVLNETFLNLPHPAARCSISRRTRSVTRAISCSAGAPPARASSPARTAPAQMTKIKQATTPTA